ncbi:MAG TPA: RNA polymerase sigma factor [Polyangia bacterium]|nr:RNA polymerase sigma factor [Polyangia bacterium]
MSRLSSRATPVDEPSLEVLAGCRAGDREAIEELFRTHARLVERVLGRLVGPVVDLEDLVQTVFLEAISALARFRGEASFKTWLLSIAAHVGQHYLRAGRVRRHVPLDLVPEEALGGDPTHDRLLDEQRLAPELHALLDRIKPKKRIALLLYVIEGHSIEEVAVLMGASQTATRSRVFFARRELRKLLDSDARLSEHVDALLDSRGER